MFPWKTRTVDAAGSVLFRGSIPPRLVEFSQLQSAKVQVDPVGPDPDAHWMAELSHPDWGKATVACLREYVPVPRELVEYDPRLSRAEREAATSAGSSVSVRIRAAQDNVLRDRKRLLRFLRCLLGDDGLLAIDHLAQKFWPREALDEELSHDADLDVESLFVAHMVYDENETPDPDSGRPTPYWLHTHGLAELGALDFDILRPSPLLITAGYDTIRAIAFLSLEGNIGPSTDSIKLVHPGGPIAFVGVEEFNRSAAPAHREMRGDPSDPVHNRDRLIACDPRHRGFFGRLFGRSAVQPSRLLSTIDNDHMMAIFSSTSTALMAERARKTADVLRRLSAEFAEFEVKPLAKLGYPVDGGAPEDREHMWFEVHSFGNGRIDATLINQPFNISGMKLGDRGGHDLELLTDWTIITPAGPITPREQAGARILRAHGNEIRKAMTESRDAAGGEK